MVLRRCGGDRNSQEFKVGNITKRMTTYEGQLNEAGKPHGLGRMTFKNSGIYEGMFADGKKEGWGRLINWDGSLYQGSFKNGLQHGEG